MGTVALAAQVILAGVLAVAAVGKAMDLPGSRRALLGFGVPEGTASVAGTLLPAVELVVAVALVVRPTALGGAVAALVLMLAFIAGIGNAMARGLRPDCNCFGALHSARAGWGALARNAALAALAAFVVLRGPGPSVSAWVDDRTAAELAAVGAGIAALGLAAAALLGWRRVRMLRSDLAAAQDALQVVPPGLPAGALAPPVATGAGAQAATLDELRGRGLPVLLLFARAGCGPSTGLLPEVERWREALAGQLTIGVVGARSVAAYERHPTLSLADAYARDPELVEALDEVAHVGELYRVGETPSAVVVSPDGTVASTTVVGRLAIEALVRQTLRRADRAGVTRSLAS